MDSNRILKHKRPRKTEMLKGQTSRNRSLEAFQVGADVVSVSKEGIVSDRYVNRCVIASST